jgi:hypothetical protein
MGAVLRWLKWALLAWAVASLLVIATLAAISWTQYRSYQVRGDDPASAELQAAWTLAAAGLDAAVERLDTRYCSTANAPGVLEAQRLWVKPGAEPARGGAGWLEGGRLPAHVAAALEAARTRMRGDGEDWLPAPASLASEGYRVFAVVGYEGRVIDSFRLIVLQPRTGSVHLAQASDLGATGGELLEGHDCPEAG